MKTLYKIQDGKMIVGVCNGLSEYFNIDVNVIRIACVLFGFVGAGVLAYIIAAVILPTKNYRDN